jgi:hypothetical protein
VLAGSVAVQILRILQAYLLGRSLNIPAPVAAYFAFIPLILLVMLLPVTFNGIGTSQFAFVWFFARAGVESSPAFALSVLFVALGIVGNLPGGLLYAFGWGRVPTDARLACRAGVIGGQSVSAGTGCSLARAARGDGTNEVAQNCRVGLARRPAMRAALAGDIVAQFLAS